jgi:hypothetical protein
MGNQDLNIRNHIGGVMVGVNALSVVDRGSEQRNWYQ